MVTVLKGKTVKKPVRAISGVMVVAVMTHPYPCPHGRCLYCPGGILENTPQSYVEASPAVMRARRHNYHPYYQTRARLLQYIRMGHNPSKVEVIIMGGTFPAMPLDYQEWFVANIFEALNRFPDDKPSGWIYLEEAQKRNEKARIRCIGLTIETRPDWSKEKHVDWFLHLGATRIELGVQSVYDDVLLKVRRGHTVKDSIEATRILKDAGYKVCYHIMPNLPGSDIDRDLEMFKILFDDPNFRPDMLKIYPTLVVAGTGLYELWKRGYYRTYSEEELIELLVKALKIIPKYVRIMRIHRDIPSTYIIAGCKKGNLRELVEKEALRRGIRIKEIRFREIGHFIKRTGRSIPPSNVRLERLDYEASQGYEVFLSYEDPINDVIVAFLRLRIPSEKAHRWEVDSKTAIVRELHVYGPQVPIGGTSYTGWQHKGFGSKLLEKAEEIARDEFNMKKLLIISGIGAREYYRRHGYRKLKNSFYMYKRLN